MSNISVPTIDNDELAAWAEKDAINQVYASKITKYLEQAQTHSEVISRKREASDNATQLLTTDRTTWPRLIRHGSLN